MWIGFFMNSKLRFLFFVASTLACFFNFAVASAMEKKKKVIKISVSESIKRAHNGELEALNEKATNGYTILHYACLKNNVSLAEKVLKAGAAINCKNRQGITPLHIACYKEGDNSAIVRLLLENGANSNCADIQGNTPLHFALAYGKYSLITVLIQAGADVNLANKWRSTLLHIAAAKWGGISALQELVEAGGRINCKDCESRTPFDIANAFGNEKASELLLDQELKILTS